MKTRIFGKTRLSR